MESRQPTRSNSGVRSSVEQAVPLLLAANLAALVGLVFLNAGRYPLHGAYVYLSGVVPPFSDYGYLIIGTATLMLVAMVLSRIRRGGWLPQPISYVMLSAGVLGLMLPDVLSPGARSIRVSSHLRDVPVTLALGFWVTILGALLLFVFASSIVLVSIRRNTRNDVTDGTDESRLTYARTK
jgi:hypothetical protein